MGGWVQVDIGGYTLVQKGCYTEGERWIWCGTGWYRRCRMVHLRVGERTGGGRGDNSGVGQDAGN